MSVHAVADEALGNTSYVVDLGRGLGAVVDPRRDVDEYLAVADRLGRKPLIVAGMSLQAVGLVAVLAFDTFAGWVLAALLMGGGTAMTYPTLLAAVSDVAGPAWRASAIGVYRLWRDLGFVVGALAAGAVADLAGMRPAIAVVAAATAMSGAVVLVRMDETRPMSGKVIRT